MVGAVFNNLGRTFSGIGLVGIIIALRLIFFGSIIASQSQSASEWTQDLGLSSAETKAFRACNSEIRYRDLDLNGSMTDFCSCFAKRATATLNDDYKSAAAAYFRAYARSQTAPSNADKYFSPASYQGMASSADEVARSVRRGGNSCTEEASHVSRRRY